jgi:hypothetical protein
MALRQANRRLWLGRRREPLAGGDWAGSLLLTERFRRWIDCCWLYFFFFFVFLPLEDDWPDDVALLELLLSLLSLLELLLEILLELLELLLLLLLLLSCLILSDATKVSIHGWPEATRSMDSTICFRSQVILAACWPAFFELWLAAMAAG